MWEIVGYYANHEFGERPRDPVEEIQATEPQEERAQAPVNLYGEYPYKVDGKGRVGLPAAFRRVLSKDLLIVPDLKQDCVLVFEKADYDKWCESMFVQRFGGYESNNQQHIALHRQMRARARAAEVDASGRIMIPGEMRDKCDIDKDVVLVGNGDRFEIWDAKRYQQVAEEADLSIFLV